jgi:hypothetical protein
MPAMQKDEICQPLRRKDHLQHMLSYESAERDGKEDENLSAVQQAKVRRPFQRNIVWTVLQQKLHQKDCTENKTMCHMPRDEACSSVWYLDGLQIVLFEAVLSKEEPDAICSTEGEVEEGKWWEAQDKKECEKEASRRP